MSKTTGLFCAGALLTLTIFAHAQVTETKNVDDGEKNAIEAAAKSFSGRLKKPQFTLKSRTTADAKVIDVSPEGDINPDGDGNVFIEAGTEFIVPASAKEDVMFVTYLFCYDKTDGKLVLKHAHSSTFAPGTNVCEMPMEILTGLPVGHSFRVTCRVTLVNDDLSETIKDQKQCTFTVL